MTVPFRAAMVWLLSSTHGAGRQWNYSFALLMIIPVQMHSAILCSELLKISADTEVLIRYVYL